jgi:hypothetical protein
VLLARGAGQERPWASPIFPSGHEAEQPALEEVRGEVLLPHVDVGALPRLPEFAQVGVDDVAHGDVRAVHGEQAVEHGVRAHVVELGERGGQPGAQVLQGLGRRRRPADRKHGLGCLGRGQRALELLLHVAHALLVRARLEPESAGRPDGTQQAVAPFACAQAVRAYADAPAELSDPHESVGSGHARFNTFDRPCQTSAP